MLQDEAWTKIYSDFCFPEEGNRREINTDGNITGAGISHPLIDTILEKSHLIVVGVHLIESDVATDDIVRFEWIGAVTLVPKSLMNFRSYSDQMTREQTKSRTIATAIPKGIRVKSNGGLEFTKATRPTNSDEGGIVVTKADLAFIIIDSVMEPMSGPNHSIAILRRVREEHADCPKEETHHLTAHRQLVF